MISKLLEIAGRMDRMTLQGVSGLSHPVNIVGRLWIRVLERIDSILQTQTKSNPESHPSSSTLAERWTVGTPNFPTLPGIPVAGSREFSRCLNHSGPIPIRHVPFLDDN